jgi:hypothetical protein
LLFTSRGRDCCRQAHAAGLTAADDALGAATAALQLDLATQKEGLDAAVAKMAAEHGEGQLRKDLEATRGATNAARKHCLADLKAQQVC